MNNSLPPIKAYNIHNVYRCRDAICDDPNIIALLGEELTGEYYNVLAACIRDHVSKNIPLRVFADSLLELLGQELTAGALRKAAWRIAGNVKRLHKGEPAPVWRQQPQPEWMPVQCLSGNLYYPFKGGRASGLFRLRILAGRACPMIIQKRWSLRFLHKMARDLGFSRKQPQYRYHDFRELVNLRWYVLIDPQLNATTPAFDVVKCPGSLQTFNKQIIHMRARLPRGFVCPRGFKHPCYRCPVGYDQCPAGTHRSTYVPGNCAKCQERRWFDPDVETELCVECHAKSFS